MSKRPIIFLLLPFCIGIILFDIFVPTFFLRNHYRLHPDTSYYQVMIKEGGRQTKKTIAYKAKVIYYLQDSLWHSTTGDIMLYLPKEDSIHPLSYGDVISLPAKTKEIENFDASFDYKRKMRHQKIYDQIFLHKGEWKLLAHNKGSIIIHTAKKINLALQNRIHSSSLPKDEQALAIGMLLGDKSNISAQTKQEFYNLSLSHILCVSGLHIGIITLVLGFCLNIFCLWFDNFWRVKNILMIVICFALAFVVGLTPSALRVAVMFSLLLLSQYSTRGYDSLNTLLVTAFVFLLFDPLLLFNISFEFSFLAVLGLLVFMNLRKTYLERKFRGKYFPLLFTNSALATLSAQVFVLPLSLLYFKRLPTYTIIANMVVVPAMAVILTTLIFFVAFADIVVLNTAIGFILHCELWLLKGFVHLLNMLPFGVIQL